VLVSFKWPISGVAAGYQRRVVTMLSTCWTSKSFKNLDNFHLLHNPRNFAAAFGQKIPLVFCAHEDCLYLKALRCPAGTLKKNCPNRSSLDFEGGCKHFYGSEFQHAAIAGSLSGKSQSYLTITGRGTGKTAIINTTKAIMEATIEPYIKGLLFKCNRPVPAIIMVAGNTKDTSLLLRNHIHNSLESNDLLYGMVADDTKTYIRMTNGSEIYFRTAGIDGRGLRGFHAEVIKNIKRRDVKTTIIFIFDEACFTRARKVISEVMRPSLQIGNIFSHIYITSTPYGKAGEVYELWDTDTECIRNNFSSYHNRFTNLSILLNYRRLLEEAGAGSIYNREVLGMFESEEGLFYPFEIWSRSIDDSLDWMTFDDIEKFDGKIAGKYYLGIDPNKFLQMNKGDYAAYCLLQVSAQREHIRMISYGKYLADTEDQFRKKIAKIGRIFEPVVICDANSGYLTVLKNLGLNVRSGSNSPITRYNSLHLTKLDMIADVLKMPSSQDWEDERRNFIFKDPKDGASGPKLDHRGEWGQGYTNDLIISLSYAYQGIMEDFGIGNRAMAHVGVGTLADRAVAVSSWSENKKKKTVIDQIKSDSIQRMSKIR